MYWAPGMSEALCWWGRWHEKAWLLGVSHLLGGEACWTIASMLSYKAMEVWTRLRSHTAAAAEERMATSPCQIQKTKEKGHLQWVSENKEEYSWPKREISVWQGDGVCLSTACWEKRRSLLWLERRANDKWQETKWLWEFHWFWRNEASTSEFMFRTKGLYHLISRAEI